MNILPRQARDKHRESTPKKSGVFLQAKAWVGGCGVAGLEAVAILKKMGCEVYATDVRDIEDQIISVGGKFVHYDPEGLKRAKDSGGYAPTFGQEMQNQQDR